MQTIKQTTKGRPTFKESTTGTGCSLTEGPLHSLTYSQNDFFIMSTDALYYLPHVPRSSSAERTTMINKMALKTTGHLSQAEGL